VRALGGCLPPARAIDKLIRYEVMLDRKLMRTLQCLAMLQQRRRTLEPRSKNPEPANFGNFKSNPNRSK
jgi:hypothetical protein